MREGLWLSGLYSDLRSAPPASRSWPQFQKLLAYMISLLGASRLLDSVMRPQIIGARASTEEKLFWRLLPWDEGLNGLTGFCAFQSLVLEPIAMRPCKMIPSRSLLSILFTFGGVIARGYADWLRQLLEFMTCHKEG